MFAEILLNRIRIPIATFLSIYMKAVIQLNKPTRTAVATICSATTAVIHIGLCAKNLSGPGMGLRKKEALARLKNKMVQNNAGLPPYTHQQKIP